MARPSDCHQLLVLLREASFCNDEQSLRAGQILKINDVWMLTINGSSTSFSPNLREHHRRREGKNGRAPGRRREHWVPDITCLLHSGTHGSYNSLYSTGPDNTLSWQGEMPVGPTPPWGGKKLYFKKIFLHLISCQIKGNIIVLWLPELWGLTWNLLEMTSSHLFWKRYSMNFHLPAKIPYLHSHFGACQWAWPFLYGMPRPTLSHQ